MTAVSTVLDPFLVVCRVPISIVLLDSRSSCRLSILCTFDVTTQSVSYSEHDLRLGDSPVKRHAPCLQNPQISPCTLPILSSQLTLLLLHRMKRHWTHHHQRTILQSLEPLYTYSAVYYRSLPSRNTFRPDFEIADLRAWKGLDRCIPFLGGDDGVFLMVLVLPSCCVLWRMYSSVVVDSAGRSSCKICIVPRPAKIVRRDTR